MTAVARLTLALLLWLAPHLAWAHAELVGSDPATGAVLAAPVPALTFRFSEPVQPVAGRLTKPSGETVAARLEGGGQTVRLILPTELTQGSYVALVRVISADAHPISASLPFALGAESGLPPSQAEQEDRSGIAALRWARDLVLLTGAGIGLYLALVLSAASSAWRPLARSAALSGGFGLILILFEFASVGMQVTGSRDLLSAPLWQAAWNTTLRGASLCQALGALLLLALPFAGIRAIAFLGPVAAVLLASGFALTGHAALDLAGINPFALAVHVLCAAFWVGSLAAMLRSLQDPRLAGYEVPRFSMIAMPVVGILLIAGAVLAVRIGMSGGLSIRAPYQILLAAKILLVVLLLCLAAFNRFRLTPAFRAGEGRALLLLRGSIMIELLLIAAILAVTAFLSHTPPGARMASGEAPKRLVLQADGMRGELVVSGRSAEARLNRPDGSLFAPLLMRLEAELASGASVSAELTRAGDAYSGTLPALPLNAVARYCLVALVSDFERRRTCAEAPHS